jgi:hypothetical protein
MISPVINELSKQFPFLSELIPIGKHEAISMTDLSKLIGLPPSDVRLMILNARKIGVLICSGDEGYYFPKNDDELKEYVRRRRKYIRTAKIALKPFEASLTDQEEGDPG